MGKRQNQMDFFTLYLLISNYVLDTAPEALHLLIHLIFRPLR